MTIEIRAGVELPARREPIELHTDDGLTLVGELSLPLEKDPVATLVCLHPLPTGGGFMDSHVIRKAAARLPALADLAVLRFNFRGVSSPRGTSEGSWGHGIDERLDVAAAMAFVAERGLPNPWLLGWSFGTEMALKYGLPFPIAGPDPDVAAAQTHDARGAGAVGRTRACRSWRSCPSSTTTSSPPRPASDSPCSPTSTSSRSTARSICWSVSSTPRGCSPRSCSG